MNITNLNQFDKCQVISLEKLNKKFVERLMDLGIYESAEVTLLKKLSYDQLFLIEVDDVEICLRKKDAALIEVVR